MKVTITNGIGFRCEISENGMVVMNSEKQIYTERFAIPATSEDVPNLVSQFNLIASMRTVCANENRECVKRVVYYGYDLAQMQVVKDMFSDDWIAMFFDSSLNYIEECRLDASEVHDYIDGFVPVRGIPGHVLRNSMGDCTNNGISNTYDRLFILSKDGYSIVRDIRELVQLERRNIGRKEYVSVKPVYKADRWYMSGGNFLYSSDTRFKEVTGIDYPVPIHDRYEG